jgi:hypothetical protein
MPPQDRVRLNDVGQTKQAWPEPSHPHHQDPVTPTKGGDAAVHGSRQYSADAEEKIVDFKPAPRPEQVGDKRSKQTEDRRHRIG